MKALARVLALLLSLLTVFAGTRAMVRALPGDPLETVLAETGTSIPREALGEQLGLDRPFLEALRHDLQNALAGDLGTSILTRQPIAPLLGARFLRTLSLTALALLLGLSTSLLLGLIAASPTTATSRFVDRVCDVHGAVSAALPTPWSGPILLYLFAVVVPVLPAGNHVLLPAVTLAIGFSGLWSRLIRARVRETLLTGAAVGARARGISEPWVVLKYGLAPASGALLAFLGTQVGGLMTGAFVTEVVFDWPGMGALLVDAVLKRDYPVVEAAAFWAAACSLGGNALGDLAQTVADPRRSRR